MALEASSVQASSSTAAIGARGTGVAPLATDKIDAATPASFASISAQQRQQTDSEGGNGYADVFDQGNNRSSWLTPLIFRAALGFAAVAPLQSGWRDNSGPTYLTDLQRGVSIYEYNMKTMASTNV